MNMDHSTSNRCADRAVRTRGGALAGLPQLLGALALLPLLAATGCSGFDGPAGEARVYLENSGEGPGGPGPVGALSTGATTASQLGFQGEIRIEVRALIEDSDGFLTNITDDPQFIVIDLGEPTEPIELGRRTLAPAEYTRVRLLFTQIEAHLTSAPPGFDLPSDGIVRVQMGEGDRVAVTRAAGTVLNEDDVHEVSFDLAPGVWLNGAIDGVVPTLVFSSALSARILD